MRIDTDKKDARRTGNSDRIIHLVGCDKITLLKFVQCTEIGSANVEIKKDAYLKFTMNYLCVITM